MGEDCGTWMPQLHFDWQSPNLNSYAGKQNGISAAVNSGINNMATRNETMPTYASSALPHLQLGHSNAPPHGWFYCLPRFRQGFTPNPVPNLNAEEKLHSGCVKTFREETKPDGESGFHQKQFLVIDQSGDKTTLIYSSRLGSPVECLASWNSKLHGSNNLNNVNEPPFGRDLNHVVGPTLDGKVDDENRGMDTESEMHEDTEEINALLYSDSEGYSTEDDEVTSTGHSPSTMTSHHNQEPIRETAEEVASSAGKTKKRKLYEENHADEQVMDTASSLNVNRPLNLGDDAESRCSCGSNSQGLNDEIRSLLGNKKMRKEKIQEVLSILQCIIPSGKDKELVELLDEAIGSLKSLKMKARALGLDA
ncbi:hypothetical protein HN51_026066 [Arachis hypogaea]|uniref:transcription factor bHLH143 n=1 Tax=Arachis hypogaea TaxID=3818 RepID=UPI000DEC6372|nr:transcription factor bHLH143 [Arachis hypogaea]QHO28578.1 Transcription factor [Arachis hypogaea]